MDRRRLGRSELFVSPLGLGTVKFGRNEGVKYPRPFDLPDDGRITTLLHAAQDLGVNLLDTAPAYGSSEERIGALLPGRRDEWVIATKVGEEFIDGRSAFDFSSEATALSVRRSLQRLRTDHLDLVLVHSDGDDEAILHRHGTLAVLDDFKRRGLVRAMGISTKTVAGGLAAVAHASPRCDVVMVTYNPRDAAERAVIDAAARADVGVLVKKALLSGHLAEMLAPGPSESGGATAVPSVCDPIETCLRFALAPAGVGAVVVGTINPEHLSHALAAAKRALRNP